MTGSIDLAALRERVRDALTMVKVAEFDGVKLHKDGSVWKGCCPFHTEKHASFKVGGHGFENRFHCFGCGEKGDIFDYWQKRHGVDHAEAVKLLAGLANIHVEEITFERPKGGTAPRRPENAPGDDAAHQKPSLPPLMKPSHAACEMIAKGRDLDAEAVWIAARVHGRVGYSPWPMSEHHGKWCTRSWGVHPSWAAIDATLNVAEFRRLDNGLYDRQDGEQIKTWSTRGKAWPLGTLDVQHLKRVLLVEGGPDMLAGYHFLRRWRMLEKVTVVCMLGASNKIRADALPYFKGARVRIMVDADAPKDDPFKSRRKMVGLEAAYRWQTQLINAGAAVTTFSVGDIYEPGDIKAWHEGTLQAAEIRVATPGYTTKEGNKVKDLNDLARCNDDVLKSDDVRRSMTSWDF